LNGLPSRVIKCQEEENYFLSTIKRIKPVLNNCLVILMGARALTCVGLEVPRKLLKPFMMRFLNQKRLNGSKTSHHLKATTSHF